jgi:hypothetical protein
VAARSAAVDEQAGGDGRGASAGRSELAGAWLAVVEGGHARQGYQPVDVAPHVMPFELLLLTALPARGRGWFEVT